MRKVLKYEFLLWVTLSIALFVFAVPEPRGIWIKIMAGYLFYLFIRELFGAHWKEGEWAERRYEALVDRLGRLPRRKSDVYLHSQPPKKENNIDVRSYL